MAKKYNIPPRHVELRTREEVLLGIVAGRDIDDKTKQMTPPLGASVTEELMLEIADKVNDGGGEAGGSGVYLISVSGPGVLNASFNDVKAACEAGKICAMYTPAPFDESGNVTITALSFILGYGDLDGQTPTPEHRYVAFASAVGGEGGTTTFSADTPDEPLSIAGVDILP